MNRRCAGAAPRATRPRVLDRRPGRSEDSDRVGAVRGEPLEAGQLREPPLHPARRSPHRDPEAVVLDDDEQRQPDALVDGVLRGVESPRCRGVVEARVAEARDDHRIGRPLIRTPHRVSPLVGEGQPDRTRQVRGDRRRLRDDRQVLVPEHLVPTAADRISGTGHEREQDVPGRVVPFHLPGPRAVEPGRPIVQQRRVRRPQRQRHRRIRLVPQRPDRVEALPLLLQHPRVQVHVPGGQLGIEQREEIRDRDLRTGSGAGASVSGAPPAAARSRSRTYASMPTPASNQETGWSTAGTAQAPLR